MATLHKNSDGYFTLASMKGLIPKNELPNLNTLGSSLEQKQTLDVELAFN